MNKPNWPTIRLSYLNAEGSLRELAKRFNVPLRSLERRSSRENWRHHAKRVGGDVVAIAGELAVTQGREIAAKLSLPERSTALKQRILSELERDTAQVEKTPPQNLVDSMDRQSVLGSVVRSADAVLDWSNPRPVSPVRIDVMAATIVANDGPPSPPTLDLIEGEPNQEKEKP